MFKKVNSLSPNQANRAAEKELEKAVATYAEDNLVVVRVRMIQLIDCTKCISCQVFLKDPYYQKLTQVCRSLLHRVRHELLFRTLRTNDVIPVGDEPLTHHRGLAGGAAEARVVPVSALKRDESGSTDAYTFIFGVTHKLG